MSYSHALLCEKIAQELRLNPCGSLGAISRTLRVSRRTLQKAVVAEMGKGFNELREEVLIATVRNLFICQPALAIKEISFAVGYRSARSFARAIKRACGTSPVEFRSRVANEFTPAQLSHTAD